MGPFSHCSIWGKKGEKVVGHDGRSEHLSAFTLITSAKLETDQCDAAKCSCFVFLFFSQLLLVVDQHSGDWWVHVHARFLLKLAAFVTRFPGRPHALTALLLLGVYAFGFLSMAPQLFVNYKVGPALPWEHFWRCISAAKWASDASLCSSHLSGLDEVCEPAANGRGDVQGESKHISVVTEEAWLN